MSVKIALAGNPNCGKTTLFNALTGSNQYVGNWPGVTVEKKEGKLKSNKEVAIMDLPGIYSLSPYTLEEVVARNYLIDEKPDAIINIIDGTNIERNLYLSTQLLELGIPVVVAVNMMDLVEKKGDKIKVSALAKALGCKVVEISALKGTGVDDLVNEAVKAANGKKASAPVHKFSADVEDALKQIEDGLDSALGKQKRFFAIKVFERDDKIDGKLADTSKFESVIKAVEDKFDDDSESIITNERYGYIGSIIDKCYVKYSKETMTTSDKIDRVVTNRWAALPIFAVVMFIVYYISVTTVGGIVTDWANDGVFGDGWFFFGIGQEAYEEDAGDYDFAVSVVDAYESGESELVVYDEDGSYETFVLEDEYEAAIETIASYGEDGPVPGDYGPYIIGIPVLIENGLEAINCADWLESLILDGIVAGVGAVLGFVPQMLVLFIFLALLEECGYMARVAFIMDRIFRKFGLSGKSFIPMLIGSGCGVPGVMASRTIENERDRRMTIMTTTFVPCGAKLPIIALIAGAVFNNAGWVAASAYFVGIAAIIVSGIILKKTKMFEGDPAPFVMELPAYHMPTVGNVLRSMWERGWSFIKKAGTIILLSTIFVWFTSNYGFTGNGFGAVDELADESILGIIGTAIAFIFKPLGWGNWKAAVAAVTGLVAKENVVGTFGILYGAEVATEGGAEIWSAIAADFAPIAAYSFLVFNLLCAPCFAAMGAIKREMNSAKWFWFAIGYQCVFAYLVSLCVYQIGSLFSSAVSVSVVGVIVAIIVLAGFLYLLFRPYKESTTLKTKAKKA